MTAKIIDGNAIAKLVRAQWKQRVQSLKNGGIVPGLAVIMIGENAASQVYVRHKVRACEDCLPTDCPPLDARQILRRTRTLHRQSSLAND